MKHGFIKVAAVSPKVTVADTKKNGEEIIKACKYAAEQGVKLISFPELSVTAFTCGDLFFQKALLDSAEREISNIAEATKELDMVIIIGAPLRRMQKLYNCAVVLHMGSVLGVVPKSNIPTHGESNEYRYFASGNGAEDMPFVLNGEYCPFGTDLVFSADGMENFTFACEVCEDLFVTAPIAAEHALSGANIICNLSASAQTVGKAQRRRELLKTQSARLVCGYVYADAGIGESTTDMVFSGHDMIYEYGKELAESKPFASSELGYPMVISEIDVDKLAAERTRMNSFGTGADCCRIVPFASAVVDTKLTRKFEPQPFIPSDSAKRTERCEDILNIQSYGLRKRLEHTHSKCAVIGISGGLDSCLALLVAVRAMDILNRPRTDITAVTMPCFGTTNRTRTNAEMLCERLGVNFRCVDIKAAVTQHFRDIGHDENEYNVVYENVQARERTQVIMDIANAEGGMVIGTGDLSELALGWATYNGDHMSMYGVNADVPKTLIRHIVRYYADTCHDDKLSEVLLDILDTPVSPELLPADKNGEIAQKTEDLVGPYELHDFFLYYFLRFGFTPEKIEYLANYTFEGVYDSEIVHKWLSTFMRRFFNQQFKRSCLPDGPKVGSVGVSPRGDLRMPSDAVSEIWKI